MSDWITDREPKLADADERGRVLITTAEGHVDIDDIRYLAPGASWMPLPKPYQKPWKYELNFKDGLCLVVESPSGGTIVFRSPITAMAAAVCDTLNKVDP